MRAPHPLLRRDSGQALVEAALTLPLAVFLFLGTLQLFLMLQARVETEYAVFRATRAGAVTQGKCERMRHAAILALLPTFARTTTPEELATAFGRHRNNRFVAQFDSGHTQRIVWIARESPTLNDFQTAANGGADDAMFDDPDRPLQRLEVRMIFWYPLRIPFANWVMSHMFLAHYRIQPRQGADPTMVFKANAQDWTTKDQRGFMDAELADEYRRRVNARQYTFPIQATYSMRMMTPARPTYFRGDPWCLN